MFRKPKILTLFILCVLVIVGLWIYSLKLNLSKPTNSNGGLGLNLKEIFGDVGAAFKNIPPAPNFSNTTSTSEAAEKVIDTLAEKLKNLSTTTNK